MNVGKSLSYFLEDAKWLNKLLIGFLVSLVPILNFAWLGYITDIIRSVSQGRAIPLPEWSDFGEKFMKGLLLFLAGLIYALPIVVLGLILAPASILPAFTDNPDLQNMLGAVVSGAGIVVSCIIGLYALALSFVLPAVNVHFARVGKFGACFEFKEIFAWVSANLSNYLVAWLMLIVFSAIIGFIVAIIPCIGWFLGLFVGVYTSTIYAYLFGQVAALQPA